MYRDFISKECIEYLYINKNCTIKGVSKQLNCSHSTIERLLKYYKILKPQEQKSQLLRTLFIGKGRRIFDKNQLYALYITQNLRLVDICKILKCGKNQLGRALRDFGISKPKLVIMHQINASRIKHISKEDLYRFYIGENQNLNDISKKFNCDHHVIASRLHEYGICKTKEQLKECRSNHSKKLNIDINFLIQKYKVENWTVRQIANSIGCGISVVLKTLKKYGIKKEQIYINESILKQYREKYGCDNISQLNVIKERKISTMKQNNSFYLSKPEEEIFKLLVEKFGVVKRQYSSEQYPFACDFYIPSKDLYIEYNGTWTHGGGAFDVNNEEHQKKLELWKIKAEEINFKGKKKDFYKNAIYVWTVSDVKKQSIAKSNNLNYLTFYNEQQFYNWINK